MVLSNTRAYGKLREHSYIGDENAILMADFGPDSIYFVASEDLAVAIHTRNMDYDSSHLSRGLEDGWLKLIINPVLYEQIDNKLAAIRAIKAEVTPDAGWYKLMILPKFGKKRRVR